MVIVNGRYAAVTSARTMTRIAPRRTDNVPSADVRPPLRACEYTRANRSFQR